MEREQLVATVKEVFRVVLKVDVDAAASRDNTPAWDSLKHIELMFALEDATGCQFSEDELDHLADLPAIVDCLTRRHAPRARP